MYNIDNLINDIKKAFSEAESKNYPEYLLNYDINNLLQEYLKLIGSYYDEEMRDFESYLNEEKYEEGHEDGYDEGYNEGKDYGRKSFIEVLAFKIIELKNNIKNSPELSHRDIQLLLTELLLDMDEDDIIKYTENEDSLHDLDEMYLI